MKLFLVTSTIFMFYLFFSLSFLITKEIKIFNIRRKIFKQMDLRFSIFEKMINTLKKPEDYEITFLNEVLKIRTQAQISKKQKNLKDVFACEEKITKVSNNIIALLNEFEQLSKIKEEEKFIFEKELKEIENKINMLKFLYNQNIIEFNQKRNSMFFIPTVFIFDKFKNKIEPWK